MSHMLSPVAVALADHRDGRLDQAEEGYRRILEQHPDDAYALHLLGVLLHQTGRHASAAETLDRALTLSPHDAACWSNRGLVAAALDDMRFAIEAQRHALAIDASFANARNNLGVALHENGQTDEAIDHYRQLIAERPDYLDAYTNLASALASMKRHDEALEACQAALAVDSANAGAHFRAGNALRELHRYDEAIEHLQRAIDFAPGHFESHVNLGTTFGLAGRFADAEARYRHALTLRDDPQIHACVGAAVGSQGRFHEEERHYRRALEIDANHADAQHNLALLNLRIGNLRTGWALYESRWRSSKYTPITVDGIPEWRGEPIAGRRLLLVGEQGYGDQLQFVRYATALGRMGAMVDARVPSAIAELVASVEGVRNVIRGTPDPKHYDFWLPMMSAPYRVADIEPGVPGHTPYLSVSKARIGDWPERIAELAGNRRRIGLAWAGSPTFANDRFRSMRFAELSALADVPDIAWFSLQKGPASAQIAGSLAPHDLTARLNDFADTAALIEQLDLLITVDTSVAHLAGALGKPVWLMLPLNYDWRWMTGRDNSPWYPGMRLFKQTTLGDWTSVVDRVRIALLEGA
jgi:tetratricopeptide (TPR) repeat protein